MSEALVCGTCDGSGLVPEQHGYATEMLSCLDCQGKGRIPVAVVPWCAEHDDKWSDSPTHCYAAKVLCVDRTHRPCRLEEPARHYVMREAE
jgi:hypothetical protein